MSHSTIVEYCREFVSRADRERERGREEKLKREMAHLARGFKRINIYEQMVGQLRESEYLYGRTDLLDLYGRKIMVILCIPARLSVNSTVTYDRSRSKSKSKSEPQTYCNPIAPPFCKYLRAILPSGASTRIKLLIIPLPAKLTRRINLKKKKKLSPR